MPFTSSEQSATLRARMLLDALPMEGPRLLIPTGQDGERPDVFVPRARTVALELRFADLIDKLWGMDPRDWTRHKPGFLSQTAISYLSACARWRRVPRLRDYWCVVWMMADAGLVTVTEVNPSTPGALEQPPIIFSDAIFRDATPAELDARGMTQADVDRYLGIIPQLAESGAQSGWANRFRALGAQVRALGFDGRVSEMTVAWMDARGIPAASRILAGQMARKVIAESLVPFGMGTPAHGWHVVAAYNDGGPEWAAAAVSMLIAAAPNLPVAPDDHPAGSPPTSGAPGPGSGPRDPQVPDILLPGPGSGPRDPQVPDILLPLPGTPPRTGDTPRDLPTSAPLGIPVGGWLLAAGAALYLASRD